MHGWENFVFSDLDDTCVKFWSKHNIVRTVTIDPSWISTKPCLMILDGFICDTYEIQPHRHLQQIEGSHDYMWSFWIVPARLSDRCRSVYATSETYHKQLQINYIVENVTLAKYARKIQQAWRAHLIRRKNAVQLIQTQFRKSISDPTYVLCRRRIVREFSELQS